MKVTKTYSSESTATEVAPPAPTPVPNCEVVELPGGDVLITLHVEAHIMKRHKLRANGMNLSRYLWENILNRALVDSVY